jgi:hypothetical protein
MTFVTEKEKKNPPASDVWKSPEDENENEDLSRKFIYRALPIDSRPHVLG